MDWTTLCSEVGFDGVMTNRIKQRLETCKDEMAAVLLREASEGRPSPLKIVAKVFGHVPHKEELELRSTFENYITYTEEAASGQTYATLWQELKKKAEEEITSWLDPHQAHKFRQHGITAFIQTEDSSLEERIAKLLDTVFFAEKKPKLENHGHKFRGLFCSKPFEYVQVEQSGEMFLCCPQHLRTPVGDIRHHNFMEIWNSALAQEIRHSILVGNFKYCSEATCDLLQTRNLPTLEVASERYGHIIEGGITRLDHGPRVLNLTYDPSCNLACPSCRSHYITLKGKARQQVEKIHRQVTGPHITDAHRIIISGMGDPFGSKLYYSFLRDFDPRSAPDLKIQLSTNGLQFNEQTWNMICHDAIDMVDVSVDAATPETYQLNRGGDFDTLLENLEFIGELRRRGKLAVFKLHYVVQANNFLEMKDFVTLGLKVHCDSICFKQLVNWNSYSEQDYLQRAIQLPIHPRHNDFLKVLSDPLFMQHPVYLHDLYHLTGVAETQQHNLNPHFSRCLLPKIKSHLSMPWDNFKSKLKLDDSQAREIKELLDQFKEVYSKLCQVPAERGKSPVTYAVELLTEIPPLDEETISEKFISFLSIEKNQNSNKTYLETLQSLETDVRIKISDVLLDEQKNISLTLPVESMLDVVTDYDPFGTRLAQDLEKYKNLKQEKSDNFLNSKTFCILPWLNFFVDTTGEIKPCCLYTSGLSKGWWHAYRSLQRQPLRSLWNSDEMREIRRKMAVGEELTGCRMCNHPGQNSLRQQSNHSWLISHPEREKWKKRVLDSIHQNYHVPFLPVSYDLRPGNLCNLKCRMCHADYSILIQQDPVQNRWAYRSPEDKKSRFAEGIKWYDQNTDVLKELLENVQETRRFYLAGGEPLINPFIDKLIDTLIERKVAHQINLEFSTNLQICQEKFVEKLNNFNSITYFISIDGYGPIYEYIRYPGSWSKIEHNLHKHRKNPKLHLIMYVTIQNYNILNITDLFRYAESLNIMLRINLLTNPIYLRVHVMPRRARELAAKRLVEYTNTSAAVAEDPELAALIAGLIRVLEQDSEKIYRKKIRKFMIFTNSLDRSRQQSFKDTIPELYNFITEDGNIWSDRVHQFSPQHVLGINRDW
ncbi:twitch domain-containing radical SAM protein [candidate division CSSED10-310 bacterium]|uniref:Twitch domain-containing radical SAM protein n=1 Tax=candidate division CSSED10-310 bacterium TaxID=2855610 RepID=A0ABV6YQS8_UNCC1